MIDLNELQKKAKQNGFEFKKFSGFVLIEIETGCDLYFQNPTDVNNYIDACDLSEHELRKRYNLTANSEIGE